MKAICVGVLVASLGWAGAASAQYNPELGEDGGNEWTGQDTVPEDSSKGDDGETASPGGLNYDGSLRLGLDTVLFSLVSASRDGGGAVIDDTTWRFGIVPSQLGINVGYAFVDQLVVGTRVQVSQRSTSLSADDGRQGDESNFGWSLYPYCEYVFTPGEQLEWLAFGTLGVRGTSAEAGGTELSSFGFGFGLGGGLHLVLSEMVSIDPIAEFGYVTTSFSEGDVDATLSELLFAARVGFSVWL